MTTRKHLAAAVLGMVVLGVSAANSWATFVPYTTEASFTAQLQPGAYVEDFDYAPYTTIANSAIASPQSFSSGIWAYTISSPAGLSGQPVPPPSGSGGAVANYQIGQTVTIAFTGTLPTAVGGIIWMTDLSGNSVSPAAVTVNLVGGGTYTYTDTTDFPAFTGFTSSTPITSMTLSSSDFSTLDHLVVGAAAVPLPASAGVGFGMLAGFGGLFAARKRLSRRPRIA